MAHSAGGQVSNARILSKDTAYDAFIVHSCEDCAAVLHALAQGVA